MTQTSRGGICALLLLAWAGSACVHSTASGEKGGLVLVRADREKVDQAYQPRRFALLVGIEQIGDDAWRPLKFAAKDARDLGAALRDPKLGGFDEVRVLTGAEATSRKAVLEAARALSARASRPDDIVMLYVSAHGTLARDGNGNLKRYLVTSDAKFRKVAETGLAVEELQGVFDSAASRRRVLVLATCHSGGGKSLLPDDVQAELASLKGNAFERPLETASRAAIVLSASDWGETAREDETLQNDVYTHFLVEGLVGAADRNGDGAVSATEAHDYARRHTWTFSQGRQRPSAEVLEVGADPIILSGRIEHAGRPELFSYAPRLDGFTLKVDGEERGELPGGAALSAGSHQVELTKGGAILMSDRVSLEVGQRLDLELLVERGEPSRTLSVFAGALTFVDAQSRNEVLGGTGAVGASLRVDRFLLHRVALQVDMSGFSGRQALMLGGPTLVPFTYTSLVGGSALLYTWNWRSLEAWAGPRVAALWIQRSFNLDAYSKNQSALSITPGVMAGAGLKLGSNWEISLNAQLMLTVMTVDKTTRAMGFTGGWLSAGYRF